MTGLLITARLGSARLPKKQLTIAEGKPFLLWQLSRLEKEFAFELAEKPFKIIIATSTRKENLEFLEIVKGTSAEVFFGSDDNIPLRHLQCSEKFNLSRIISIDGDDILCSPKAARIVYENMLTDSESDLFSTKGLPLGMNLFGYTIDFLKKAIKGHENIKLQCGWGWIFDKARSREFYLGDFDLKGQLRMTLDYPEDADFFKAVISDLKENLYTLSDIELISYVKEKGFDRINSFLTDKYWDNFEHEKEAEVKNG